MPVACLQTYDKSRYYEPTLKFKVEGLIVVFEDLPPEIDTQVLAIDGKTLCGSDKQDAMITHLLSVVSHQLGITLTQQSVDAKTNEIPIATQIL